VLDAAALSRVLPAYQTLTDLGSGAGFPGVPLAILHPERTFTLVEAREKRHHFQRAVLRVLGLENVVARRGRAEVLDPSPSDGVVAQAMADAREVVGWMLPWIADGGFGAIPGGPDPPDPGPKPELREVEVRRYRVPLGGRERTLWIARK
jgi:16S rRNA (guanine527-N7)-methyltransferase